MSGSDYNHAEKIQYRQKVYFIYANSKYNTFGVKSGNAGVFTSCVTHPGFLNGACANCHHDGTKITARDTTVYFTFFMLIANDR